MAYCTQTDIENVFGTSSVASWSQLNATQQGTADTARIALAIAWADQDIDSRFRDGRYAVPLTGTSGSLPSCVVDWSARKAGLWLYTSRGVNSTANDGDADRFSGMEKWVNDQIDLVNGGKLKPALTKNSDLGPSAPTSLAGASGVGNWWE